jgi:hypothetical protein
MRATISIIALSVAAALSTPAAATPTAAAATGATGATGAANSAAAAAHAKSVKYCMKTEPGTGSRLRETKCLTKDEWAVRGIDVDEVRRR